MAHEYSAQIIWTRGGEAFTDGRYNRGHLWRFDGIEIPASASPQVVRPPFSRADAIDPEEALVASLSSCHMLFFLYFAAKDGLLIDRYSDRAVGILGKNEAGRDAMVEVKLRPDIAFAGDAVPAEHIHALHERAHDACYIANSVTARITIEPPDPAQETSH